MSGTPTESDAALASAEVQRRLIAGIQTQTVKTEAEEILASSSETGDAFATSALAACTAISSEMRALREEVVGRMKAANLSAAPEPGPEDTDALQYHVTAVSVPAGDLQRAVGVMQALGFRLPVDPTPARLSVLARTARSLRFVRFDDVSARVDLHVVDQSPSPLPRALHPKMADLGSVALPRLLAPLYWLIRPLRVLRDRFRGGGSGIEESNLLGTPTTLVDAILTELALTPNDVFVDLGCGDGRVVEAAARSGCRAIGYEIDPALARSGQARLQEAGHQNAVIHCAKAETADLSDATVVFCFLPRHFLQQLLPHLRRHMHPNARLVSHEQLRLQSDRPADRMIPIFSKNAMTVLHVWGGQQRLEALNLQS